jgi:hypothetical protein
MGMAGLAIAWPVSPVSREGQRKTSPLNLLLDITDKN